MAKMFKHLVFGMKKNPPAPPRPDYEGERLAAGELDPPFFAHDYENIPKSKLRREGPRLQFAEAQHELLVFDNYSEPPDLCTDRKEDVEDDPLYMSPLDDRGTAPPLDDEQEDDMYCVPYDTDVSAPPVHQPCFIRPQGTDESHTGDLVQQDATYDVVPDVNSEDEDERREGDNNVPSSPIPLQQVPKEDEYDEPWEWSVGTRLTLQVSPTLEEVHSDPEEGDEMTARQQRRHLLYETAFDSRIKRDTDDLDNPLFTHNMQESVARAASRSSFGSTSGSSASSTPTHQPMEIVRPSHTPTERRKVTLVRNGRSMSPRARMDSCIRNQIVNQNFERRISFSSQWDSISRCSGSSEKSSSQESMNVEQPSSGRNVMGRSASRDSLNVFREDRRSNYPHNWKELSSNRLESNSDKNNDSATKRAISSLTKVNHSNDPELKENNSPTLSGKRSSSLLSEVKPLDNLPQSPDNDVRSSEDYDPPWDVKKAVLRPTGSVSVPERLSSSAQTHPLPTSITHDQLEAVEEGKDKTIAAAKPTRPTGPRPNLNLNLNSDSPRKGKQNLTLNFGCSALSAVGEKVDPQLTLEKQGWYHGSISRVDAEAKLRVLKEGSYLVRNSESSKQDYSLSLKSARGFMHMKIVPTNEGRFILGQFSNPFSSIPEMIQHYSLNKLPIKGAEHMSLLYPVIDQLL